MSQNRPISTFIEKNYLHFNTAALVDAAKAYKKHIGDGKKMLVSLAGAMSTGEVGHQFCRTTEIVVFANDNSGLNSLQLVPCNKNNMYYSVN